MPSTAKQNINKKHLDELMAQLESGSALSIRHLINTLHPGEIAHLLESMTLDDRQLVWSLIEPDLSGEVLVELNEEVRAGLVNATNIEDLIQAVENLESDDLADLLPDFPEVVLNSVLSSMDHQDRSRFESVLTYDDDTAGGLMSINALTVRPDVSLDVVLRYLRLKKEMPELTDSLIVVDRKDMYLGVLPLSTILTNDPQMTVNEIMNTEVHGIPALLSATEVAILFEQRDLVSAPVVDEQGKLQGRITVDDVVDVIRDEADHSIMSMAGLDEEQDMFAPVVLSAKRRALWLGLNLFTAFLASWVIAMHELALEHIVALAILMPIVASMGGIAGSQTLTVVIRGLALRQIGRSNAHVLISKELLVGVLNGSFWAVVVAMISGFWFESFGIGLILGAAMIINLVCAALAGALIPMLLQQIKIDPALAGGVILTTITDMIGFWAFLGLATVFLL